uniref:Uncharacterized protein n=1 Tax=Cacopsylla melanoneura TaxID=428564 RepID=A0A8D8VNL8_9HEMI
MPLISSFKTSMQRLLRRTHSVRAEKVCTALVIPNKRHSLLVDTTPTPAPPNRPPPSPPAKKSSVRDKPPPKSQSVRQPPSSKQPPREKAPPSNMALGTVNNVLPPKAGTPGTGGGSVRYPSGEKSKTAGTGSVRYKDRDTSRHHRTHSQTRSRPPKQVCISEPRLLDQFPISKVKSIYNTTKLSFSVSNKSVCSRLICI